MEAPGLAYLTQLPKPAVGHHRHSIGHADGELVIPAQPSEHPKRTDPLGLLDQHVDQGTRLGGGLPPPDSGARRHVLAEIDHVGTRWIKVPVPRPPPQHIVTRPRSASRRSSSATNVASNRAPVAPTACPSAIAPPLTLTRSVSERSSRCHASTTEENASLTSNRSMSSMLRLLRCKHFRVAGRGPVSMMMGSPPTVVGSRTRARVRNPSRCAASPEHSSTAAAPSLIGDDDPAVIRPPSLRNTGLRLASVSTVVPARPD